MASEEELDHLLPVYVPLLKGQEGEYRALKELSQRARRLIYPLVDIPFGASGLLRGEAEEDARRAP